MSISNWNFNSDDYTENTFQCVPAGDYRVRIANAEETTSKNLNDMVKLTLEVSGHASLVFYYLVFMPDNAKMTNQKLGAIFNSFGIAIGDMNVRNWIGKVGAARIKNELYNGEQTAKVHFFIEKGKQDRLPAWQEAPGKRSATNNGAAFVPVSDEDLPF